MNWDDFDTASTNVVSFAGGGKGAADDNSEDILDNTPANRKKRVPTSSLFDKTYGAFADEKVPIPLRVLMATQQQFQIVTIETDTGYSYTGELQSIDAHMNVKLKDAEVKREVWVKKRANGDDGDTAGPSPALSSTFPAKNSLERRTIYHKTPIFGSSTMIRGASIVFVQLPQSLEPEQRYLATIVKKEIAEKKRKAKKERLERIVETGKKRAREAAAVVVGTANTAAGGAPNTNGTDAEMSEGTEKAKRRMAKAEEAARAAEQKLRIMNKSDDKKARYSERKKNQQRTQQKE